MVTEEQEFLIEVLDNTHQLYHTLGSQHLNLVTQMSVTSSTVSNMRDIGIEASLPLRSGQSGQLHIKARCGFQGILYLW